MKAKFIEVTRQNIGGDGKGQKPTGVQVLGVVSVAKQGGYFFSAATLSRYLHAGLLPLARNDTQVTSLQSICGELFQALLKSAKWEGEFHKYRCSVTLENPGELSQERTGTIKGKSPKEPKNSSALCAGPRLIFEIQGTVQYRLDVFQLDLESFAEGVYREMTRD